MPGPHDNWRYIGAPLDNAPRSEHEAYAKNPVAFRQAMNTDPKFQFFWIPCPRCGKMFGGHEVHYIYDDHSLACCPGLPIS